MPRAVVEVVRPASMLRSEVRLVKLAKTEAGLFEGLRHQHFHSLDPAITCVVGNCRLMSLHNIAKTTKFGFRAASMTQRSRRPGARRRCSVICSTLQLGLIERLTVNAHLLVVVPTQLVLYCTQAAQAVRAIIRVLPCSNDHRQTPEVRLMCPSLPVFLSNDTDIVFPVSQVCLSRASLRPNLTCEEDASAAEREHRPPQVNSAANPLSRSEQ